MSDVRTLDEWLAASRMIRRCYLEELGRDIAGDPEALANWLYHWRESNQGDEWFRERFRESEEYQHTHTHPQPHGEPTLPEPVSPLPSSPEFVAGRRRVLRVTDERDGDLLPRMYSYWSNAVIRGDAIYVFAGHSDQRPRFFKIEGHERVERLGPLLPYTGTSEGWYWDAEGWIYLLEGPRLRRVNPFTGDDRVVFDISETHPGCRLWQAHSSDDGRVHSATVDRIVAEGAYPHIGTVVFRQGRQEYYPAQGALDESQVTPDGAFLIIKEDDNNRIIALETGATTTLPNADGACGHSDCGPGFLVGEDDVHGECVLWDLRQPFTPERRRTLMSTWNMGHVSVRGGRCLLSDDTHLSLIALDGSGVTPLVAHGMVGSGYDCQVQGNLDPTCRVACFMSNHGAERLDVFLLEL